VERLYTERLGGASGPPWTITAADLDDAYRDGRLREAIAKRFNMTLELDNRFRIIALTLALHDLESNDAVVYRSDEIQERVMAEWPQGFGEVRMPSAFQDLLREMVGLGVLRQVDSDQFALRNLNIVPLLGTRQQIQMQLVEARQRAPEAKPNPKDFRTTIRIGNLQTRAPLTAHNLELVRGKKCSGIVILRGGRIADGNLVRRYLTDAFKGTARVSDLNNPNTKSLFQRNLVEALKNRDRSSGTVLIVESGAWEFDWVNDAWQNLGRLTAREGWVRCVFLLHPEQAWQHPELMQLETWQFPMCPQELDLQTLTLGPWSETVVRDHIQEDRPLGTGAVASERDVLELTGGWPWLIKKIPNSGTCDVAIEALEIVTSLERDREKAREAVEAFGCHSIIHRMLLALVEEEPMTRDQWPTCLAIGLGLPEEKAKELASQLLLWLEIFDYVRPIDKGCLSIDSRLAACIRCTAGSRSVVIRP
jgi:hypothetical protein